MARNMAAADPITLDAALMAQAQRTEAGITLSSSVNPVGNGMPMANPTGLIRATETNTLRGKGRLTPASAIGGRMAESTSTAARMSIRTLLQSPAVGAHEPIAGEASEAAREKHREDYNCECIRGMAEEQNELLNERDLDQDVTGSDEEKEKQGPNAALPSWQSMTKQERRQRKNQERGKNADSDQPEKNRKRAIDFVILSFARCMCDKGPEVPWLNGEEEERPVIGDRRDVKFVASYKNC